MKDNQLKQLLSSNLSLLHSLSAELDERPTATSRVHLLRPGELTIAFTHFFTSTPEQLSQLPTTPEQGTDLSMGHKLLRHKANDETFSACFLSWS